MVSDVARCTGLGNGTVYRQLAGAKVGLLTTFGFGDTIKICHGWRSNPWDHRAPWLPSTHPAASPVADRRTDRIEREISPLDRSASPNF
jgi:hypothetical protein